MAMSDPLGDMLTRIRNGQRAKKASVTSPAAKLRARVLEVLQRPRQPGSRPERAGQLRFIRDSADLDQSGAAWQAPDDTTPGGLASIFPHDPVNLQAELLDDSVALHPLSMTTLSSAASAKQRRSTMRLTAACPCRSSTSVRSRPAGPALLRSGAAISPSSGRP